VICNRHLTACLNRVAVRSCSSDSQIYLPSFIRTDLPDPLEQFERYKFSVFHYVRGRGQPDEETTPLDEIQTGSEEEIINALQWHISPFAIIETFLHRKIKPTVETYRLLGTYYIRKDEYDAFNGLRAIWMNDGYPTAEIFPEPPFPTQHERQIFIVEQHFARLQQSLIEKQEILAAQEEIIRAHLQDPKSSRDLTSNAQNLDKEIKELTGANENELKKKLAEIQKNRKELLDNQISLRETQEIIEVIPDGSIENILDEIKKVLAEKKLPERIDFLNAIDITQQLNILDEQISSFHFSQNFDTNFSALSKADQAAAISERNDSAKEAIDAWARRSASRQKQS